jgi:hypothetical protein
MARISEPALDVSRAIARYGWYGGGIWRGFMLEEAFLCITRIVQPEQRLVCLSYR